MSRWVATLLSIAGVLWAQAPAGRIGGTVKDTGGAAVSGASVRATISTTGAAQTTSTGSDGRYQVLNLPGGTYTIEVSKPGFRTVTRTGVAIGETAPAALDIVLEKGAATDEPSLGDLGFSPAQTQGSAEAQARLDRRSHMLRTHQRLGLITLAPMVATLISSSQASEKHHDDSGRTLHAALGASTAAMYITTASFAIFAPKARDAHTRGPIRLHKALAWIHGPGMILTPILGAIAFRQIDNGERVHGIAKAHATVAWTTVFAYGAAMASVSNKF